MAPACVPITDKLILLVALLTTPRIVAQAIRVYRENGSDGDGGGR